MTIFDIFAGIFIISLCTYGFSGGVMNVVLRVFSWYGALIVTILVYPLVKDLVLSFIPDSVFTGYITLIACGALFSVAVYFITEPMLETATVPKRAEKFFGAAVGGLLAILLLGTTHFVAFQVYSGEPSWVNGSKILPIIQKSSSMQTNILEDNLNRILLDLGIK